MIASSLRLVVGLGNPGLAYKRSRHNAGFMILERLAARHGLRFNQRRAHSKLARGTLGAHDLVLAMPQTYVNLSGQAVQGVVMSCGVRPSHILVVYDDLDLPLGTLRIRPYGGPGTHNGMRSIVEYLGTTKFPRLRFGIGTLDARAHPDFVLSDFGPDEAVLFDETRERAVRAIEVLLSDGIEAAMNEFNG